MFKKFRKIGSDLVDATVEAGHDIAEATSGAIDGIKAKANGAKIITEGTKEVHVTIAQINELISVNEKGEIILDDTATDDGYDKVRITIVGEEDGK